MNAHDKNLEVLGNNAAGQFTDGENGYRYQQTGPNSWQARCKANHPINVSGALGCIVICPVCGSHSHTPA